MDFEQKLALKPFSSNMAMVILWRWKNSKKSSTVSDKPVLAQLEMLKAWELKHTALENLVGRLELGGIPLALIQAGSFVQQNRIWSYGYFNIYEARRKRGDLCPILHKINACGIVHVEQQSIWTTCTYNSNTTSVWAFVMNWVVWMKLFMSEKITSEC